MRGSLATIARLRTVRADFPLIRPSATFPPEGKALNHTRSFNSMSKKPVMLCIMDGFGWTPDETYGNAVAAASKPNLDKILSLIHI